MTFRVLVATTSPNRREWYRRELERRGCDVEIVSTGIDCVEMIRDVLPDAVILESFLPWGGSDGVLAIREADPELKAIHAIVVETHRDAAQTYRLGVYELAGYWKWPTSADDLLKSVRGRLERPAVDTMSINSMSVVESNS